MKVSAIQAAIGAAILFWSAQPCAATASHRHQLLHAEKRHAPSHLSHQYNPRYEGRNTTELKARGSGKKCTFPEDKGLIAITPGAMNGGWAMAPDQECVSGTWCPIACPSGKVMNQWKPDTIYSFPESTYGGVYCNDDGEIEVPFEDEDWCVEGTGTVAAVNNAGKRVSFCQTCLPGYEDMIIPTDVDDVATIAVPSIKYWDATAAHYYINEPGVGADEGCHWGDESKPIGNWAYYVAGANTVADGSTFVKVGLNPVWQNSALFSHKPTFGLKIECPDGGCNGLPCSCDGNGVVSDDKATGAGGSDFCVVTVSKGSSANIVVYNLDGSGSEGGNDEPSSSSSSSVMPEPTSTSTPTTSSTPTPTTTSTPTTTATSTSTSLATSTSTSSSTVPTISSSSISSKSSSASLSSPTAPTRYIITGGVFNANDTESTSFSWAGPSATSGPSAEITSEVEATPSDTNTSEGSGQRQSGGAVAGLVVAFIAAVYIL
ncbi:beta-glucosidase-domain-containing protein [Xylariomycetidae sp. FL2044]|nr:beta-glucosidase-domain-containing protein [Xylariomycetidae sp. FL2044]